MGTNTRFTMADFTAILAMTLQVEDDLLTPVSCRMVEADRVTRLQALSESLTPETAVAVLCTMPSGETIETIVNSSTMEQCIFEDPIMCTELSIGELVEAQFTADGPWTLCVGDVGMINEEKRTQFKRYDEMVRKDNPDCLMTLRTLLRSRPITTLYSGGGAPPHVASHEGFTLRMPKEEVATYQATNEKGVLQDIPRPASALRKWDAAAGQWLAIDPTMDGAPATEEQVKDYFCAVVSKLKASPWLGAEMVDNLVTSEKYGYDSQTERPCDFEGSFQNEWTDLVVATTV